MTAKAKSGSRVSAKSERAVASTGKKTARQKAPEPLSTQPSKNSRRPKAAEPDATSTPSTHSTPSAPSPRPAARRAGAAPHQPASAPKRPTQRQKAPTKHGVATQRVQQPQLPERPSQAAYQQIAEEYEQAIRGYASYYLQQQGLYDAGYGGQPSAAYGAEYAGNAPEPGYGEARWIMQTEPTGEERIYLLEQAASDFHQALPYIRSLSAGDKNRYLASWRDYLTAMAGMGAELIDALEKELASLSGPE